MQILNDPFLFPFHIAFIQSIVQLAESSNLQFFLLIMNSFFIIVEEEGGILGEEVQEERLEEQGGNPLVEHLA